MFFIMFTHIIVDPNKNDYKNKLLFSSGNKGY